MWISRQAIKAVVFLFFLHLASGELKVGIQMGAPERQGQVLS